MCSSFGGLCQPGRRDPPQADTYRLLLQNWGLLEIERIAVPPTFSFPRQDYAVLSLREAVAGIAAIALAREIPPLGSAAEVTGFGAVSGSGQAVGIKRTGRVLTTSCQPELNDGQFDCGESAPGPGGGEYLSGGLRRAAANRGDEWRSQCPGGCGVGRLRDLRRGGPGFATAVAPIRDAIAGMAGSALGLAASWETVLRAAVAQGRPDGGMSALSLTIQVPEGAARLVVVSNGDEGGGNDHALRLRHGHPPGAADDPWVSDRPGVFESCVLPDPQPGTWHVEYRWSLGLGGAAQLSATAYSGHCPRDMDGNGQHDALTDGLLVLRHLSGRSGADLTDGVLGPTPAPWRDTAAEIATLLDSAACVRHLDVDGDGVRAPQTDGRLVARYLFGFRGAALAEGAVGAVGTRPTGEAIGDRIAGLLR